MSSYIYNRAMHLIYWVVATVFFLFIYKSVEMIESDKPKDIGRNETIFFTEKKSNQTQIFYIIIEKRRFKINALYIYRKEGKNMTNCYF